MYGSVLYEELVGVVTNISYEIDMILQAGVDRCGGPSNGNGEAGELGRTELLRS